MHYRKISTFLFHIGVNPCYKGYPYLIHVIELLAYNEEYPLPSFKKLYIRTAEYYEVSPSSVADNIRTILRSYWRKHKTKPYYTALFPMEKCPTPKVFISILAEHILEETE